MTDIDALARRIAREIVREAHRRYNLMSPRSSMGGFVYSAVKHAWLEARAAGRSEGFAAGAQAMRERVALTVLASSIDGVASGRLAAAIRAIPLPDEKEKP